MKKIKFILLFLIISFNTNAQNPAEIDLSFEEKFQFGSINDVEVQSDGKILVGGNFTSFNGTTQNRLIRLNVDGTKDTTFNIGTGFPAEVQTILVQPDNKILVGGIFTTFNGQTQRSIIRLNENGTKDTSFVTNISGGIYSISLQLDGKILLGGSFTIDGVSNLIRLNTTGFRDTTFNIGTGLNLTSGNAAVRSIVIQQDGKILVGGGFNTFFSSTQYQYNLIRLNINGTKDTSFASYISGFNNSVQEIVLQSDGKILVGGNFTIFNGITAKNLIRLNNDGTKDTSFELPGTGFSSVGLNSSINAIVLQSDGKILAGGGFTRFNGVMQSNLIRLNTDGTKDTTFDIVNGFNIGLSAIKLQTDGKILVGGAFSSYNGIQSNYLIRLKGGSSLNTDTFDKSDIAIYPNPTSDFINVAGFEPNESATIINLNGQVLKSAKIDKAIDVSDLKAGIYFVKIKNVCNKFIKK
jgi:uncharacterized delta-60 repeat protein